MKNPILAGAVLIIAFNWNATNAAAQTGTHIQLKSPLGAGECQDSVSTNGQPVKVCRDGQGNYNVLPTDPSPNAHQPNDPSKALEERDREWSKTQTAKMKLEEAEADKEPVKPDNDADLRAEIYRDINDNAAFPAALEKDLKIWREARIEKQQEAKVNAATGLPSCNAIDVLQMVGKKVQAQFRDRDEHETGDVLYNIHENFDVEGTQEETDPRKIIRVCNANYDWFIGRQLYTGGVAFLIKHAVLHPWKVELVPPADPGPTIVPN